MRVLLVDDDEFAAELASVYLAMSGFDVIVAESALAALVKIDSDSDIRMVISDYHMPEITGLELLEALRANGWNKPFILLSGSEITDACVTPDCWVKKDEHMPEKLVDAVSKILMPSEATE